MAKKLTTYVAFIVDESGSMDMIRQETVNNFNEQLQVLKEESNSPEAIAKKLLLGGEEYEGVETFVSYVKFNQEVNTIIELDNVNSVEELTLEDFAPSGTTALYDAIGSTIERFQEIDDLDDPGTSVLFVIITDGQENSSRKFGRQQVKSLVDELNAGDKWTFTFMGTQDALEQAYDIGFDKGNVAEFAASSVGMSDATFVMSTSTRGYYDARLKGMSKVYDFYSDEKDEEDNEV